MQDLEKEQMMSDIYGLTSKKLLGYYDHNSSSWKTSEDTLDLDLEKSSPILPLSGMTQHGDLFALQTLEHHTDESGFSFLPTPVARDYKGPGSKGTRDMNLPRVFSKFNLLPTPTAMHVRNHDEPVENYEQRVLDYEEGRTKGKPGKSTGVAVRLLATPVVNASHQSGTCRNWGGDLLHDVKCTCSKYRLHWIKVS
jgi:hypothetical protein